MDRRLLVLLLALAGLPPVATTARAQGATPSPAAKPPGAESLSLAEQQLADRYHHLEGVLLRMAEVTAPSDPRRANRQNSAEHT